MFKFFTKKTNQQLFDKELKKVKKTGTPIPNEKELELQRYINEVVLKLPEVRTNDDRPVGMRFYFDDILWEINSPELPKKEYVYLWDVEGIVTFRDFTRKLTSSLERKYNAKIIKASSSNIAHFDYVTRD
ncbi:MAG: hypothetical protein WC134_05115 [Acholeplasmataceae bacterium]